MDRASHFFKIARNALLIFILVSTAEISNQAHADVSVTDLQAPPTLSKNEWMGKVSKALRYGHGVTSSDDLQKLETMTREQIVDKFMMDPNFGDTVLDFNLYFLGFKLDNLRKVYGAGQPLIYSKDIFNFPGAIESAKAVIKGGDYWSLVKYSHPFYLAPLPRIEDPNNPNSTPDQNRAGVNAKLMTAVNSIIDDLNEGLPKNDRKIICRTWNSPRGLRNIINDTEWPLDLYLGIVQSPSWFRDIAGYCQKLSSDVVPPHLLEVTVAAQSQMAALIQKMDQFKDSTYKSPSVLSDIRSLNTTQFHLENVASPFSFQIWRDLPNSSTNQNRKRASYILKRFFCDDLTPIGVVDTGGSHGQGPHGSDPKCMACHFKLDPMAGFFRDRGNRGFDFGGFENIIFDDNFKTPLASYDQAWSAPAGSGRDWNVGYVRSLDYPQFNDYRSTLPELFELIGQAPEVKKCLVRRAYEYFNGEGQVFDSGYLDDLTQQFTAISKTDSTKAFKTLLKRILLNNTFTQRNPDSELCYDYAPGVKPAGRPPCRVATILEHNCTTCHSGQSPAGGLDLSNWHQMGSLYGFVHLDESGKQINPKETFKRISDRLSVSDPDERMPLGKYMSDLDRVAIAKWVEAMSQ